MKFSLDQAGGFAIRDYSEESITVVRQHIGEDGVTPISEERVVTQSLILSAEQIIEDWPVRQIERLDSEHIVPILELDPELVILGVGATLQFPRPAVLAQFANAQIGVEVMDTGAACRTYNVLTTEGRRVVAALVLNKLEDRLFE